MEREEREYREAMEREQAEAIREAHETRQELAAQSSESIIKTYVKAPDTLKTISR